MFSFKKHLPLLFLLLAIALSSCDGRDKKHRTTQQDLIENKALDTFSGAITTVPESYFENVTDTLFSNGYQMHTKFYSSMESGVIVTDSTDLKTYYRDILIDIKVSKDSKEIFNNTIDKAFLMENNIFNKNDAADYLVADFWLDNMDHEDGFPILVLQYENPKSKKQRLFRFSFHEKGLIFEEVN
ncbi:hypothetical protein [Lacinutrix himadriensis]|uniref:hypothetical protein n=1 Tax=Lacinutrix himadriensis TaxID=641549 RepID=UPI0006E1C562|nr:hypothetical protein [Lacinutrix himadriensis]